MKPSLRARLAPYLELVRVFLTPTCIADSLAGYALALSLASREARPGPLILVGLTSIASYWFGMAANDLFDARRDLTLSPGRPLPSGRISRTAALGFCSILALCALGLGFLADTAWVVAAILVAALTYDGGGKNIPYAGNLVMGLCRSGNFLLGACAASGTAAALGDRTILLGASAVGIYIALVTSVSRLEDAPFSARRLCIRALPAFALPLVLASAAPWRPVAWFNGVVLVGLLSSALWGALRGGRDRVHGAAIFVRGSLPGLFLVNAAVLIGLGGANPSEPLFLATLYGLFAAAWLWKRAWMRRGSTGS